MDSSSSKNINVAGSPSQNGLGVVSGSNPSVGQVSNSSLSINVADGSIRSRISNPSLSGVSVIQRSNNTAFRIFIGGLVIVTLGLLGSGLYHTYKTFKDSKDIVNQKKQDADQTKSIISQPIRKADDFSQTMVDVADNTILFTLHSNPSEAEVYKDGEFIGVTSIYDMKFPKSDSDADIVVATDGYNVARLTFDMSRGFSENITLDPIVVERSHRSGPRPEAAPVDQPSDGSINSAKPKVVGVAADSKTTGKNKKKDSTAPAAPVFVVPE